MLLEITLVLVVVIFAINVLLHKPMLDSFLFSLALAVGLTPQLLPAIITVNLASGARTMAKQQVIVKKLSSIENFGSMNILCSDKTGTITEGKVKLHSAFSASGEVSDKVLKYARLNASLQQGFHNPIDEAIVSSYANSSIDFEVQSEVPYDFIRKRLTIQVRNATENIAITKGALNQVLEVCNRVETENGSLLPLDEKRSQIIGQYTQLSAEGYRSLGVAYKTGNSQQDGIEKPVILISTDRVDAVNIEKPHRWDIHFIQRFMITFGILSSVFDCLTFVVLLYYLRADEKLFQTGWFVESVISASLIVLVIRTRLPFFKSLPGRYLTIATLLVVFLVLVLPFTSLDSVFGFVKLPLVFYGWMLLIVALYIFAAEITKRWFYRKWMGNHTA